MQSGSYLPSLGTRVSLTCIGLLLLFFGILGMGLSTELQVLRADQRIDSLAQLVREQDAADAELRNVSTVLKTFADKLAEPQSGHQIEQTDESNEPAL